MTDSVIPFKKPYTAPKARKQEAIEALLPERFTLTVEQQPNGRWAVTSDAHPEFLYVIDNAHLTLREGLVAVPHLLAKLLYEQRFLDRNPAHD